MTPNQFYQANIATLSAHLLRVKSKRNVVTIFKVASFVAIFWCFFLFVARGVSPALWGAIGAVVAFVALTVVDTKIVALKRRLEELIACNQTEIDYLRGDYTGLSTGNEFLDPAHPYSYDLDIFGDDSLFQHLNRTVTLGGTEHLCQQLLRPCLQADEIIRRQVAARELSENPTWCLEFRAAGALHATSQTDREIVEQWRAQPPFFASPGARHLIRLFGLITILTWALSAFSVISASIPLLLSLFQLGVMGVFLKRINEQHNQLRLFVKSIGNYLYLVQLIDKQEFTSDKINSLKATLFEPQNNALTAFSSLHKIVEGFDQRNNVLVAIALNALYLRDLHCVIKLDAWRARYGDQIERWIATVSEVDALVSMSTFRFNHPDFEDPTPDTTAVLQANQLAHPLLRVGGKVANDFTVAALHNLYIVTGANMAGKSTFLRTVGVNLVLACAGCVVDARRMTFSPMQLFTSMRTTDNLAKGTSYFHAELLRLKLLMSFATPPTPLFIILDEMLKGTNSVDKLNGSLKFLVKLLDYNISGLVATHDLELGRLAGQYPQNYFNVCFEIQHQGNNIVYDYRLREGVSQHMNASILLEQMGLI